MSATKRKRAPGGGRKPEGDPEYPHERASDYPAQMLRFPIRTLAPMRALAQVRGVALWRLFNDAAREYLRTVRGNEAREVNQIVRAEAARLRAKIKR